MDHNIPSTSTVRLAIGAVQVPVNSEILITDIGPGGHLGPALACFTPSTRLEDADWLFPNGTEIPKETEYYDIVLLPGEIISVVQQTAITLHRDISVLSPTGQYCCVIPANGTKTTEQRLCINVG